MTRSSILTGAVIAVVAVAMASCRANTPGQAAPPQAAAFAVDQQRSAQDAPGPPGEVPPMQDDAVRAEHLLPLTERTRTFRVIDGEELDKRLPLALRPSRGEEPGEWVLEFSDLNTLYLEVAPEGHVMIVRLDLPPEDMFVVYDPPVRMLPAEIRPHQRIDEQSVARVYDLETGELEHTGDVEHKVLFASRSRFGTDVGVWDGYLIPIQHEIDIPWADVRLDLAGGYVPELGLVYRRMNYTRESLGLFGDTQRRAAVLSEELN